MEYSGTHKNKIEVASAGSSESNSAVQLKDNRSRSIAQKKQIDALCHKTISSPFQLKANSTGLPDHLKSGIENLSGHSMDDVKVHYNSSQPAQLNAHAFAQGSDIHIASGQEKHLAHEAWHVVQQKQGRVKPTKQLKSKVNINDDASLEKEADVMGAKALGNTTHKNTVSPSKAKAATPVQRVAQLNSIIKHDYRNLENPAYTVAKHLGYVTGLGADQVKKDIAIDVPDENTLDRPDRVIAYLDKKTGSGHRTPIITQIGRLGRFEEALRGRSTEDFDGGHLLALELWNGWADINTPSNVAPQRTNDNRWRGGWRQAEQQVAKNIPVIYEAAVNYPDRTYTVTAAQMGSVVKPKSATRTALDNAGAVWKLLPWTVNTWTPSQFHLSVTSTNPTKSPTGKQTISGADPTNWVPILHRIVSPIKGLITRIIPFINLAEHQKAPAFLGGIDVRSQGNHPIGDSLNEIKQTVIDLVKLTSVIELTGIAATTLSLLVSTIPGMASIIALSPAILAGSPLAAILIYAIAHQFNISRMIPEVPVLNWIKYLFGLLGL
ncbi:MAG TPA: DUF4157 domain-containing protein [Bacteroidia bacterium]|nr:DUF4157 domain-containing protein [Bacteroidia bacterium]